MWYRRSGVEAQAVTVCSKTVGAQLVPMSERAAGEFEGHLFIV